MPIYEYHCLECGHGEDVLQKVTDELLVDCPACGKPRFTKKISAPGFQLKGTGWYETDFKDKSTGGSEGGGSAGSSAGKSTANGKTANKNTPKQADKSDSSGASSSSAA